MQYQLLNFSKLNRREFLRSASALGGALLLGSDQTASATPIAPIKTVYAVFKCHLDIGFTDTQAGVFQRYFDQYFPEAMDTAAALRAGGGPDRYVWTTGSWLLYQYLEQATPAQRKRAEQAITIGDLSWHGLPFNWQTEMLDGSLIEASLGLSAALDRRFGTKTTGAKMTDVPGHTRGLVGPLARAGITLLDIGVNPASTPPDVPPLFCWRDPDGAEILVLYHRDGYGGIVAVPGGDVAVSVNVRSDNSGVHTPGEIKSIHADLRRRFPGARIVAAGMSAVAAALAPYRATLPVMTQEIGDTWIYGCASDPIKIAHYRELSRLRREWLASGDLKSGDQADLAWIRTLILAPEHTWGCDIKSRLGDWNVYTPTELKAARAQPSFQLVEATWAEKRANNAAAVAALPPKLRTQAQARLAHLAPARPQTLGLARLAPSEEIKTKHFVLSLDSVTGAVCRLKDRRTGREWASAAHPLALFSYQTFNNADYQRFLSQYVTIKDWWPPQDFGKPGLDKYPAESRTWNPVSHQSFAGQDTHGHRIVTELSMQKSGNSALTAWPEQMMLEMTLPDDDAVVHLDFQWFGKAANRLPEALWLSFQPAAPVADGWRLDKSGHAVAPHDVVSRGGRSLHAVTRGVSYTDAHGQFQLDTLDAPVVAPGRKTLLDFDNALPDMSGGIHVNLFNNTWGTNYVMWLDDDMRFRFTLRV